MANAEMRIFVNHDAAKKVVLHHKECDGLFTSEVEGRPARFWFVCDRCSARFMYGGIGAWPEAVEVRPAPGSLMENYICTCKPSKHYGTTIKMHTCKHFAIKDQYGSDKDLPGCYNCIFQKPPRGNNV